MEADFPKLPKLSSLRFITQMPLLRFGSRKRTSDIDSKVLTYLSKVPLCTGLVTLADESDPGFLCRVSIETAALKAWLLENISFDERQSTQWRVGRAALEIWLDRAQVESREPVGLPSFMALVLNPYVEALVQAGVCSVYCNQCDDSYGQIDFANFAELDSGADIPGVHSWRCAQGHLLYDDH